MEQMLEQFFISVLNMSLTAGVAILAVLAARLFLKRAPRIFSYGLWAVVLFRLLCPVSFAAPMSLLGALQNEAGASGRMEYVPADIGYQMEPEIQLPAQSISETVDRTVNESLPQGSLAGSVNPIQIVLYLAARIWLLGIMVLLAYSAASLIRLNRRLKRACPGKKGAAEAAEDEETGRGKRRYRICRFAGEGTPFVYGIFRPRIYLPEGLSLQEERYILLHEEIHIRREDSMIRALAWLALVLHWFNPLVWAAFHFSGRDMEESCDEAVIRRLGNGVKKEYSASLLAFAAGQKRYQGMPLAFGEGDTKSRIQNILHFRKPGKLLTGALLTLCAALAVWLLANPSPEPEADGAIVQEPDETIEAEEEETLAPGEDGTPAQETSVSTQVPQQLKLLSVEDVSSGELDGAWLVRAYSVSRSAESVDLYWLDGQAPDEIVENEGLAFAEDCEFYVNREMDRWFFEQVDFPGFADAFQEGMSGGPEGPAKTVECVFENGQIVQAYLRNPLEAYGITAYEPPYPDTFYEDMQKNTGLSGPELLDTYYTLVRTEEWKAYDGDAACTLEIYSGNIGDGESGIILFRDAQGEILFTQSAHSARAGWNNVYRGELDGAEYILILHLEDRDTYGGYEYQVLHYSASGVISLAAGSSFEWNENGTVLYDDGYFQEWMGRLTPYLEHSHLLLSTQEGELRTEPVSETERYSYEALRPGES